MRIGLDVMGGDFAPDATIAGAVLARKELSDADRIVLIGNEEAILKGLKKEGAEPGHF
jgi:phosphate acyltransferase